MFETALAQLTYIGTWVASRGFRPRRMADSAHQSMVPFQSFPTKEGWIVIACPKQRLWESLCDALDRPDLAADPRFADFAARDRNRDELLPLLTAELAKRTAQEWLPRLAASGVPSAPVNDVGEALADPQAQARGAVTCYDHPVLGDVSGVASPLRLFSFEPIPIRRAPLLGEDSQEVLGELLGYNEERIRALEADGAFGAPAGEEVA